MAKTKPTKNKIKSREKSALNRVAANPSNRSSPPTSPAELLTRATVALQQGDIEGAIPLANRALSLVDANSIEALPALNLLGEIHVELGDIDTARQYFFSGCRYR